MMAKPEQHLPPTAEDDPESAKALSPQWHVVSIPWASKPLSSQRSLVLLCTVIS